MIIRQLGLRQGKHQFIGIHAIITDANQSVPGRNASLIRQSLIRFSSTDTTTTTTTTIIAEQTLPLSENGESSSTITPAVEAPSASTPVRPALNTRKAFLQAARQRE